ncbi:MAG TPA: YqgE/AlgH family protein [Acidimicrobiales bacterium]|nr:YqgE/AlgH family protein [Acidimicrobiales bacterium]
MVPITGRLLVASPMLGDPNFSRTVVLMLAHGDEGALGLVLNRSSDVDVSAVLPDVWRDVAPEPRVLFVGGPVASDSVIGLARVDGEGEGFVPMTRGLATVDLERTPASIGKGVTTARVFAGHAGWGPGQLEGELEVPGWIVVDAEDSDAFTDDPDGLWRAVLARQPGRLGWLANFPDSLLSN